MSALTHHPLVLSSSCRQAHLSQVTLDSVACPCWSLFGCSSAPLVGCGPDGCGRPDGRGGGVVAFAVLLPLGRCCAPLLHRPRLSVQCEPLDGSARHPAAPEVAHRHPLVRRGSAEQRTGWSSSGCNPPQRLTLTARWLWCPLFCGGVLCAGGKVRLPGETPQTPNVYDFGTPYTSIVHDLRRKNEKRSASTAHPDITHSAAHSGRGYRSTCPPSSSPSFSPSHAPYSPLLCCAGTPPTVSCRCSCATR